MISLSDNGVLIPLSNISFNWFTFRHQPLRALRVDDDILSILSDNAAAFFIIDHGVVHCGRMNVALVTADRPLSDIRQFFAAILNSCVVTDDLYFHPQLKIPDHAFAPDQKLIEGQLFGPTGLSSDATVFDSPKFRIAVPASEIFAVKQRTKVLVCCLSPKCMAKQKSDDECEKVGPFHSDILSELRNGRESCEPTKQLVCCIRCDVSNKSFPFCQVKAKVDDGIGRRQLQFVRRPAFRTRHQKRSTIV